MPRSATALGTLLLVVGSLLAGCASREAIVVEPTTTQAGLLPLDGARSGDGQGGNATAPGSRPAPRNGTVADNVGLRDEGDLAGGASHDWNWTVLGGFKTAQVALQLEGPEGAPLVEVVDLRVVLEGGDPREVKQEHWTTVTGGSPFCICHAIANDPNPYGNWTLSFNTGPSAARYTLAVDVTY